MNRGVWHAFFPLIKYESCLAAFWINCRGLIELAGQPAQESIAIVKSGQNKSLNKELCCMFREKGPAYKYTYKCIMLHDSILDHFILLHKLSNY